MQGILISESLNILFSIFIQFLTMLYLERDLVKLMPRFKHCLDLDAIVREFEGDVPGGRNKS